MNIDNDLWIMLIWGVRGITQNNWTSVICYDSAVAISSNQEIWIEIACPLIITRFTNYYEYFW